MTAFRHPETGVMLNELTVLRTGSISDDENRTAALLLAEGHPRWVVAAMLGRHPLAFNGTGRSPADSRRKLGGHLKTKDARTDIRQDNLLDWQPPPETPGEDAVI